ncbi:MAG: YfhO family protein, partial [Elusimicrobia bacterium]|nr:YfhO family protein [Elusimicrobiota bacterium]
MPSRPRRPDARDGGLDRILEERGGAAVLLLLAAVAFVVFRPFLLGREVYLFKDVGGDSLNIYYPNLRLLFGALARGRLPAWSFRQGLGQDLCPFSLNDPFLLILLPFGRARLAAGLAWMEAAKLLAAGALFRLYLRSLRLSPTTAAIGAVLYAFSGFAVVGSAWAVFSTEAVWCAALLYAFERYLRDGSWAFLPPAAAGLAALQPADLWPYALFFLAYGTARFADVRGAGPRAWAAFMLRLAGLAALGAALGGFAVLPELRALLLSPRVSAGLAPAGLSARPLLALIGPGQAAAAVLRLFSSDMLGAGGAYRGWYNYLEAPLFYCGLTTVLLAPQAFAALSPRRRRIYAALAAVVLLPVVFPYFRYAFWAFALARYRTLSLFVAVVLLFLALHALDAIERGETRPRPAASAAALAGALLLLAAPSLLGGVRVNAVLAAVAAGL